MKKVLSITLTLAMLLGSILMLVPTVSATEGAGTAAPSGLYYENDFDKVTATDTAGVLSAIGWTVEKDLTEGTTVKVEGGRLVIDAVNNAVGNQEAFMVITDNDALLNGYAVDFDIEMLAKASDVGADSAFSVHTAVGDYAKRSGRHGWIGQIRWNTNILAGAEAGGGWAPAANGTPDHAKESYLKTYDADGNVIMEGEGDAAKPKLATTMQNIRIAVRIVYDAAAKTVKTYTKSYSATGAVWTEADLSQTGIITDAAAQATLTNDLRIVVYKGLKVAIDNLKVGTLKELDKKDVIYSQNFDAVTGADTDAILLALGWEKEQEWAEDSESSVTVQDGRLIVDAVTDQEEFIVLKDNAALLDGYVIECDMEIISNTKYDEASSAWVDGPQDNAVGFTSSLGDFSARAGRQGWWMQLRAYAGFLAGSEDGTGWKNVANNTKRPWLVAMAPEGTPAPQLCNGIRLSLRAEFDKANGVAKTYGKAYTKGGVVWGLDDLQAESNQADYTALLTDDLRLITYKGMKVAIDNLVIYKNISYTINVNGEETSVVNGPVDLGDFASSGFAFAVINNSDVVTDSASYITPTVKSIDVFGLSVNALKGASIRATDNAALRFRTAIAKADYDALVAAKTAGIIKNFEVGTLTIDYATLGALGQLKLDTEGATKVVAAAADVTAYGESDYAVNCVIEVAADKLNTKYAAAGYAIVEFNDGSKLELTAKYDKYTMVRSVAEIAQTITFDEAHGLSADQLAKVNAFAAKYVVAE